MSCSILFRSRQVFHCFHQSGNQRSSPFLGKDEIDLKNPESKKIANILFNMHLDLDYDSCIDDYKEELDMLSQTIDKLSEGNDPLFYVLQTIAGQHEDEENLLVDGDGDFVER